MTSEQQIERPILPHSKFGGHECCGALWVLERSRPPGTADIICAECHMVVRMVPVADLQQTLDEMKSTLDMAVAECPHCGAVHLSPGCSELFAYTCTRCGEAVWCL